MGTAIQKKPGNSVLLNLRKAVSECFENIPDHRPNKCIIPLGESLILITTIVLGAQDLRLSAKIPKQERQPNAAMIFMSQ